MPSYTRKNLAPTIECRRAALQRVIESGTSPISRGLMVTEPAHSQEYERISLLRIDWLSGLNGALLC